MAGKGGGDYRQRLSAAFVQAIEEHDGLPWDNGFEALAARPFNPARGVRYRGGNVLHLLLKQLERGSDDPRWMTLNQANEAGYSVRRGAKATYVEYWDFGRNNEQPPIVKVDEKGSPVAVDDGTREEGAVRQKPRVFFAQVFNGADIVGLPVLKREMTWRPNEAAERLLEASGVSIEHRVLSRAGGALLDNAAYYDATRDHVVLPPREQFKSAGDYYATVLHELAHWTGHGSRLDRALKERGTAEYAREELRAEIAAMQLTSMLGIEGTVQNHARYAAHWVEQLKADKHELFRAARDAEQIVEHLLNYVPELRDQVDAQLAQNVLEKGQGRRARQSGAVGDLPNFVPETAAAVVPRTGRDDPRWAVFEETLRSQAERFQVDMRAVEKALRVIEPTFTPLMDKARENGYGTEEMRSMLIRSLVDEMRTLDERRQAWDKFAEKVRAAAPGSVASGDLDAALHELHGKYQAVINKGAVEQWPRQQVDAALYQTVFGNAGRRPVTPEFVMDLVEASPAATAVRAEREAAAERERFVVSVAYEKWTQEDYAAGEAGDRGDVVEREAMSAEDLLKVGRQYGLSKALSSTTGVELSVLFRSQTPDANREHFEHGIDTFYTLSIDAIDGQLPTAEGYAEVAQLLGLQIVASPSLGRAATREEDEDDLVLTPIGGDESEEELGLVAETPIRGFALDDAEVSP